MPNSPPPPDVLLKLSNRTSLFAPASLSSITTFVILEQETWFEKEFVFLPRLIQPGMTAVDIGANLGVYSLALSRLVGPQGRVYAYEPTGETRARLERSRDANSAENLEILGSAVADAAREGRMVIGGSSELNYLSEAADGAGEAVRVTSLDIEARRLDWGAVDFVKIDAEGAEKSILRGGQEFFEVGSPIVMLEVKAGAEVNRGLVRAIEALGYNGYRLNPGTELLIRTSAEELERSELNLFALKPERAAELKTRGLLVETRSEWESDDALVRAALSSLRSVPFAVVFPSQFHPDALVDPEYAGALAAYHRSRDSTAPANERWASLNFAHTTLAALCEREARFAWLSTFSRVAGLVGDRANAAGAADALIGMTGPGGVQLGEPFWPAHQRYDELPPGANPAQWFLAAAVEQLETSQGSAAFRPPSRNLAWLCGTPFASAFMLRRLYLHQLRRGQAPTLPTALLADGPENVNAAFWRNDPAATLLPAG